MTFNLSRYFHEKTTVKINNPFCTQVAVLNFLETDSSNLLDTILVLIITFLIPDE